MASRELIERAGKALAEAAEADSKVILFGSYAGGEQRHNSDLDFLVIEPEVENHFGESVRLARLVGELGIPADVVVASEAHVREWGVSGTMIHDALTEGRVVGGRVCSGDDLAQVLMEKAAGGEKMLMRLIDDRDIPRLQAGRQRSRWSIGCFPAQWLRHRRYRE